MNKLTDQIKEECEIILVDDGSEDGTDEMMEHVAKNDSRYVCIFFTRNFGHQKALTAGLDYAKGKYVMILDADLQDPPEMYFDFRAIIDQGNDIVYGIRKNRKEGFIKRTAYKGFYSLITKISNYPIPSDSGDFCMMNREVLNAININREDSRFLRGIRSWVGFKQVGLEYERHARVGGNTKYTLTKLIQLASDGIFNYTTLPIRLLTIFGSICIISSLIYFLFTIVRKYLYTDVPVGFTALLFMIILFGGFQLLALGILGEYIQRIFFQVKHRSLYLVRKVIVNGEKTKE